MRAASSLEFTRCAPDLSGLAALRDSLLYLDACARSRNETIHASCEHSRQQVRQGTSTRRRRDAKQT